MISPERILPLRFAAVKWLKEIYDWGSFLDALLQAIQMTLGVSIIGSLAAMVGVVISGATGVQIILAGLFTFIGVNLWSVHKILKQPKPAFEILFDQTDARFVRPTENNATRYFIGLHVLTKDRSINFPNLRVQENDFARLVFADNHRDATGKPYVSGPSQIYVGGALDPEDIELIWLCDLPNFEYLTKESPLAHPQRFVLEARGQHTRTVRREFEYDPAANPRIRMLPQ